MAGKSNFEKSFEMLRLAKNPEELALYAAGFTAAYKVLGVDCPIPYDESGHTSFVDTDLHTWIVGQIMSKFQADEAEMTDAEKFLIGLRNEGLLGEALEPIACQVMNALGAVDTDKYFPDDVDEDDGDKVDPTGMPGGEPRIMVEPAPTGEIETIRSREGMIYRHGLLFRQTNSHKYITIEELKSVPPSERTKFSGHQVMIVSKGDGKLAYYDDELNPREYAFMFHQMEKTKHENEEYEASTCD